MLPSIDRAKNAIDKALAERDGNIDKFCSCLDKDIGDLNKEVKEVKQEAQNPMILDANAEKAKVKKELDKLQTRMQDLQNRAFTYKSYQKNFKVSKHIPKLRFKALNIKMLEIVFIELLMSWRYFTCDSWNYF